MGLAIGTSTARPLPRSESAGRRRPDHGEAWGAPGSTQSRRARPGGIGHRQPSWSRAPLSPTRPPIFVGALSDRPPPKPTAVINSRNRERLREIFFDRRGTILRHSHSYSLHASYATPLDVVVECNRATFTVA